MSLRQRVSRCGAALVLLGSTSAGAADPGEAGKAAYARGDYAGAEQSLSTAIAKAPNDPLLRYYRGAALTKLGRWNEAIEEYERVLQLRPSEELASAARAGLKTLMPLAGRTAPRVGDADETSISLQRSRGGWIADVVVNDGRNARFLVDTGASVTAISPELAEELGIKPERPVRTLRFQGIGGKASGPLVKISSLRIGDLEARDVAGVILELNGLEGILGNTFLGRYSVTLDGRQGLLTVRRK
jgi:aspartyl protease family protein